MEHTGHLDGLEESKRALLLGSDPCNSWILREFSGVREKTGIQGRWNHEQVQPTPHNVETRDRGSYGRDYRTLRKKAESMRKVIFWRA